jgi:hypothetical protein
MLATGSLLALTKITPDSQQGKVSCVVLLRRTKPGGADCSNTHPCKSAILQIRNTRIYSVRTVEKPTLCPTRAAAIVVCAAGQSFTLTLTAKLGRLLGHSSLRPTSINHDRVPTSGGASGSGRASPSTKLSRRDNVRIIKNLTPIKPSYLFVGAEWPFMLLRYGFHRRK